MFGRPDTLSRETKVVRGTVFMWYSCRGIDSRGCRRAGHFGVRASIVVMKPGNAGGAKGRRKVDVV
jgi:hypothetical protein